MTLQELNAKLDEEAVILQETTKDTVEYEDDSSFTDEDFWEALQLIEEHIRHLKEVVGYTNIAPGRRQILAKAIEESQHFLSYFVPAEPTSILSQVIDKEINV